MAGGVGEPIEAIPMEKEVKLVKKVKRLLRKAGLPRWLHRFGPKKYEFWHHALALLVKQECRLSYRRVSRLLSTLGFKVPTYSALAKMAKRLPSWLWQRLLAATVQPAVLAAVDGTGLSRTSPSHYYLKRIDKLYPVKRFAKLSILADTRRKKVLALRFRAKPAHDIRDVKALLKLAPNVGKLVGDKAYDAEWLHELAFKLGITTVIPVRKGAFRGFYRHKMQSRFNKRTYNRRSIVESVFSALKRKFGSSVSCRSARTQRAEVYCRAIMHNITAAIKEIFNYAVTYRCQKGKPRITE